MNETTIKEEAERHFRTYEALQLFLQSREQVERIQNLVQYNSDFFGGVPGGTDKLTVAADYLEGAISRYNMANSVCQCPSCRNARENAPAGMQVKAIWLPGHEEGEYLEWCECEACQQYRKIHATKAQ